MNFPLGRVVRFSTAGALLVVMAVGMGACSQSRDTRSPPPRSRQAAGSAGATWSRSTPSGARVRVRPAASELRAGPNAFALSIDPAPPPNAWVAIDLASPTMPLHGVSRFVARRTAPGQYVASLDVPMEGRWALYVNVASDTDTVSVAFDALPPLADDARRGSADTHQLHPMRRD